MLVNTCKLQLLKQFTRTFHISSVVLIKPQCTIEKRAKMLMKLIQKKDKKKNWYLQVGATGTPDKNIYDKVHKSHRRAGVLNSLFMKNITDVLSTGDCCSEIMGYGVEITGVRVTSDYQLVNVFWQLSNVDDTCNANVEQVLVKNAAHIRIELIRRNVLGKVPRIFFIRDPTNKRAAEFAKCLQACQASKQEDPPTLPVTEFPENLYKFSDAQDGISKSDTVKKFKEPKKAEEQEEPKATIVGPVPMPEKPPDMKFDIMGLDHEKILKQVLTAKRKLNEIPQASSCVVPHTTEDERKFRKHNIVYSIPTSPLLSETEREKQLKKFYIDRKTQWSKFNKYDVKTNSYDTVPGGIVNDVIDDENFEDDYIEDEYQDTDDRYC